MEDRRSVPADQRADRRVRYRLLLPAIPARQSLCRCDACVRVQDQGARDVPDGESEQPGRSGCGLQQEQKKAVAEGVESACRARNGDRRFLSVSCPLFGGKEAQDQLQPRVFAGAGAQSAAVRAMRSAEYLQRRRRAVRSCVPRLGQALYVLSDSGLRSGFR